MDPDTAASRNRQETWNLVCRRWPLYPVRSQAREIRAPLRATLLSVIRLTKPLAAVSESGKSGISPQDHASPPIAPPLRAARRRSGRRPTAASRSRLSFRNVLPERSSTGVGVIARPLISGRRALGNALGGSAMRWSRDMARRRRPTPPIDAIPRRFTVVRSMIRCGVVRVSVEEVDECR